MVPEAQLEMTDEGLVRRTDGWFVLNVAAARWGRNERYGSACSFEGDVRFQQYGINIQVLMPDQPNAMYHAETAQEDFLVLSGECVVIVEGQARRLRQWDFVHCPPGTAHVFIGAGEGPCAILMTGARQGAWSILYPVNALALARGAGVATETTDPREAYAEGPPWTGSRAPDGWT